MLQDRVGNLSGALVGVFMLFNLNGMANAAITTETPAPSITEKSVDDTSWSIRGNEDSNSAQDQQSSQDSASGDQHAGGSQDASRKFHRKSEFHRTASTPAAVPVPAAIWLFASGLGVFGIWRRQRGLHQ